MPPKIIADLTKSHTFQQYLVRAELSVSKAREELRTEIRTKYSGFTARGEAYRYRTATQPLWTARVNTKDIQYRHAFNCSVFEQNGLRYIVFRGNWNPARLVVAQLDADWQIVGSCKQLDLPTVPENSSKGGWWEDPRSFWHTTKDGEREHWICYAGVEAIETWKANICLARIDESFNVIDHIVPKHEHRTWSEKNWSWYSVGGEKLCVYMTAPDHIVLRLTSSGDMEEVAREHWEPNWWAGDLRGGASPVLHEIPNGNGKREWYSFIHGTLTPKGGERFYTAGLYTFSESYPYKPMRWIPWPIMAPNIHNRPIKNDPAICLFPCGSIYDSIRKQWIMSYGYFDTSCWLAGWLEDELEQYLIPVEDLDVLPLPAM